MGWTILPRSQENWRTISWTPCCSLSQAGERYAVGFHGEGLVLVTREGAHYSTDSRYIEAARQEVQGAQVELVTREQGPSGPGRRLSPGARPEAGGL